MGHDQLRELIAIAEQSHLAEILYRKSPADQTGPRIVEPYTLTEGKQDIMVRAFQVEPKAKAGWKYFMVHRIVEVKDTGTTFDPRRAITMTTGEIIQVFEPWNVWDATVASYRDLVLSAVADMEVSLAEVEEIDVFKKANEVSKEMVRSVHSSILMSCLTHMLDDGVLDERERQEISQLQACFDQLGWAVGD